MKIKYKETSEKRETGLATINFHSFKKIMHQPFICSKCFYNPKYLIIRRGIYNNLNNLTSLYNLVIFANLKILLTFDVFSKKSSGKLLIKSIINQLFK